MAEVVFRGVGDRPGPEYATFSNPSHIAIYILSIIKMYTDKKTGDLY